MLTDFAKKIMEEGEGSKTAFSREQIDENLRRLAEGKAFAVPPEPPQYRGPEASGPWAPANPFFGQGVPVIKPPDMDDSWLPLPSPVELEPPIVCCYYPMPREEDTPIAFRCDNCGRPVRRDDRSKQEKLIKRYCGLAVDFRRLGHRARVLCMCADCAGRLFPTGSHGETHSYIFEFQRRGTDVPVYSYLNPMEYEDGSYQDALKVLKDPAYAGEGNGSQSDWREKIMAIIGHWEANAEASDEADKGTDKL